MNLTLTKLRAPTLLAVENTEKWDHILGVLDEVCDHVQDCGAVSFTMEVCGRRHPVDVRTVLSVLLVQLPAITGAHVNGTDVEINMHEQGGETLLRCVVDGEDYIRWSGHGWCKAR